MDCIFCQISSKNIKSYIINESINFISFLDIHPHSPGHSLVIPKEHFVNFKELPEEYGNELVLFIKDTMFKISKALNTSDFTLGINEGSLAGQVVMHLHIHIIPRFENDGGGSIHSVVFNQSNQSLDEIFKKIVEN